LPPEIEKILVKPEISNQIARNLCTAVTPFIERNVKDSITKILLPAYQAQSSAMHQELSREIHTEITNLKKEVISWQTEALRGQESLIRDMDQTIRAMSEQMKFLALNLPSLGQTMTTRASPSASSTATYVGGQSPINAAHHRAGTLPSMGANYPSSFQQGPPPQPLHGQWYGSSMSGNHGGQGTLPQQSSQPVMQPQSAPRQEEVDDTFLQVLGTQDLKQLRELLARSNPEVIMPTTGTGPLSQAVILTLVHRLSAAIGETSPVEEAFKSSLWWLQRAAQALNTNDPLISAYTGRVLPSVQAMLNTTKQRFSLLPGGPQLIDTTRMISDVQETLSRKPM